MNKQVATVLIMCILIVSGIGFASAQEEPEIAFSEFQFTVIVIGAFGGLVTAYNGYVKNKNQKGKDFVFDRSAFLDRVFMAILGSIPLAIAESANVVKLDLYGAWIIFAASIGTAELIMEIRNRNKK